jgi:hypothetical protein
LAPRGDAIFVAKVNSLSLRLPGRLRLSLDCVQSLERQASGGDVRLRAIKKPVVGPFEC